MFGELPYIIKTLRRRGDNLTQQIYLKFFLSVICLAINNNLGKKNPIYFSLKNGMFSNIFIQISSYYYKEIYIPVV